MPNTAQVYNARRHPRAVHPHRYGVSVSYVYEQAFYARHRRATRPRRALIIFKPVVTTNASGPSGKVQSRATIAIPRRKNTRFRSRHIYGTQFSSSYIVQRAIVNRRAPARGKVAYLSNVTPNYARQPGTVQQLIPVFRRKTYRLVQRGTIVRTTNNPHLNGTVKPLPARRISRRYPARALYRHLFNPQIGHGPSGKAGPSRVYRRKTYRSVWLGTVVRTVNAPHPSQYVPHIVVAQRDPRQRHGLAWRVIRSPFLRSTPVTGKGSVHRRKTARAYVAHVRVPFLRSAPVNSGLVRRRVTARSFSKHVYGFTPRFTYVNKKSINRRARRRVIFGYSHGQVPLLRTYVNSGLVSRTRSKPSRVNWNFSSGAAPEFIVTAFVVKDWCANVNPIFYSPPIPPGQ